MAEKVWLDIVQAAAYFFMNPVWLAALIVALGVGYFRVKRERRFFKVRLLPGVTELKKVLAESIGYGVVLSIVICAAGLVVDPGWIVLFSAVSFIAVLTFYFKIASPIYFTAAALFAGYGTALLWPDFTLYGWNAGGMDWLGEIAITVAIIGGLLLIIEGFLIKKNTVSYASPLLMKTQRGLEAAVFKSKRIWLLPVVFLVPGDMISSYLPYWPQFTLGAGQFSFVPVPVVIGFSQVARSMYPDHLFAKTGRAVLWTGFIITAAGVAAIWMPFLSVPVLIAGVLARLLISIIISVQDRRGTFVASPKSSGVVIAGVLPDSPGEKMGLLPGECIRAVNGITVSNEKELYDAIQINAAHCRLQVVDRDGEVRLMQQVIYRYDHHRLGVLVVR